MSYGLNVMHTEVFERKRTQQNKCLNHQILRIGMFAKNNTHVASLPITLAVTITSSKVHVF